MILNQLNHRQQVFVSAYIALGGNGVRAAKEAGYRGGNDYLAVQASRLIANDKVQKALQEETAPIREELGITAERTLKALADIAYAPWRDFIRVPNGNGGYTEAKLHLADKIKALIAINRIMGFYPSAEQKGTYSKPVDFTQHRTFSTEEARTNLLDYLQSS